MLKQISTYIYVNMLNSSGLVAKIWRSIRLMFVHVFNDPPCQMALSGKTLLMPLSHGNPQFFRKHKQYDRLPQRISEFLQSEDGYLKCIDVGANVGDTIAAFSTGEKEQFLAIEPNRKYFEYLEKNYGSDRNVILLNKLVSSESGRQRYSSVEVHGTSSFTLDSTGTEIDTITVNDLVEDYEDFIDCNVLKTDTDGHDFGVLRGAMSLIRNTKPIVLFESDVFSNDNYISDLEEVVGLFNKAGYAKALVYDNLGYLLGVYDTDDLGSFCQLLFYQMIGQSLYFDILMVPDGRRDRFIVSELNYFAGVTDGLHLATNAKYAQQRIVSLLGGDSSRIRSDKQQRSSPLRGV